MNRIIHLYAILTELEYFGFLVQTLTGKTNASEIVETLQRLSEASVIADVISFHELMSFECDLVYCSVDLVGEGRRGGCATFGVPACGGFSFFDRFVEKLKR